MDGADKLKRLLVEQSAKVDVAVEVASKQSISGVAHVLRSIAGERPDTVDEFITAWISTLEGAERLAASLAVSSLYVLDLVHLEHAEDRMLKSVLDASIQTLQELQRELTDYAQVASSPDTSFDTGFAETLHKIAVGPIEQATTQLQTQTEQLDSSMNNA
ncbi:hypothetical protein OF385_15170 [Glutamicibacter sp. JL.03c]|uniref:hypothetical protein n=1 Tax=Glutamicibacter sp. JL.03c TaxID=2984842 RepID=UPI0021F6CBF5|nr:hypothetical protein [Glutamicibacter sp. JL.03c]UYQ77337.1 hypothetical protein OF385_15170 [Glutamicibacter sp. JL.03c]